MNLKNLKKDAPLLSEFLGRSVLKIFFISFFLGFSWFLIEMSFVFLVQALFANMGLIQAANSRLMKYLPSDTLSVCLFFLGFTILRSLLGALKQYYSGISLEEFTFHQKKLILKYVSSPYGNNSTVSQVVTLLNQYVLQSASIVMNFTNFINTFVSSTLLLAAGLYTLPYQLIIGAVIIMICYYPLKFINTTVTILGNENAVQEKQINKYITLTIRNSFLLRIYNLIEREIDKSIDRLLIKKNLLKRYYLIASLKSHSPVFFGGIVLSIIIYVSLKIIPTDPMKLLAFIYIFIRLAQTGSDASSISTNLKMSKLFIIELFENFKVLKRYAEQKNNSHAGHISKIAELDKIVLDNISFSYSDDANIFKNFNLTIKKGDVVLIKGESGVGKSTLLSLILGILKPHQGKIYYNDKELTSSEMISNIVGYVGPEPYIIPGTITENLMYGNFENSISSEKLINSLQMSQLHTLVKSLPRGLDTELSEHTELSTGQKQRLAIARALSRNPTLLILDEATANLDSQNESDIIDNLSKIKNNLTMIIISHKNSFERIATTVINLGK